MSSVIRNIINSLRASSIPVYLISVGFVSILGQVVILRELNVAFYGIELIYILSLGLWLLGTAIGAAFGRRSYVPKEGTVQVLFLLTAAVLMIEIVFIRGVRKILGGVSGGFLPFQSQIVGMTLAVLPLSFLAGVLFQWIAKRFLLENRTLAEAYSLESGGGVLGGLSSTLLLAWGLQNLSACLICAACTVGVVSFYSWRDDLSLQKLLSVGGLAIILVLFALGNRIDRFTTTWNHPYLIESRDTPYGRITVTSLEEEMSVFENDALSYETETTAAEEFVQLSTLEATRADKVLVLGGGFEGIVPELLKLPVDEIDYVEINRGLIEVVQDRLPPELRNSLSDEKVRIIYEDPRQFLNHSFSYDIILVAMPEPMSAQNNRFYTREFFEQCSSRLNADGIVAFRIPSAENLWTSDLQNRNRSIYAALKCAFNNVVVIPGVTNIFIASRSTLATNPAILIDRFRIRDIKTRLVTPEYINYVFTNDRFGEIDRLLSAGTSAPNSDIRPSCYGYTISIWLSKFFGGFALPDAGSFDINGIMRSPIFWLIVVAASTIALAKRLVMARRFALMFSAGLAGMLSETVLILNFQSKNGALYQDIGILLMSFMAGLTLGASIVNRIFKAPDPNMKKWTLLGTLSILGLGILNVGIYYIVKSDFLSGLVSTSLVLTLDGGFVSAIFAVISLNRIDGRKKAMTWLYSADLAGGCAGSLAASLILLPVFGIPTTALLTAVVAVCALAFQG